MEKRERLKNALLRLVVYSVALFSLTIVLSTRIDRLGKFMTNFAKIKDRGGLYSETGLNLFYEKKDIVPIKNDTSLEDASIIVFSDSFGEKSYGKGSFHMRLQDLLGLPVFWQYHKIGEGQFYLNPWVMLEDRAASNPEAKVIIWLRIERFLSGKRYNSGNLSLFPPGKEKQEEQEKPKPGSRASDINRLIFDNSKIEYVIKNGFLTRWIYESMASGRFLILGNTSHLTPQYSLYPRNLFYFQAVNSFNEPIESKGLEEMAQYFVEIQELLLDKYGMTLVLVPIPDKYTIYHDHADPDSN